MNLIIHKHAVWASAWLLSALCTSAMDAKEASPLKKQAFQLFETHCMDCHDDESKKGDLDLVELLGNGAFDASLVFENLITARMPPKKKKPPSATKRRLMLEWLARQQPEVKPNQYRRISRHEFVHSVNDLLGTEIDLTIQIPDDRNTHDFDSNRKILLTKELLSSYFKVADEMLDFAFPDHGFSAEQVWTTSKIKDSHHTYNIYTRDYQEGILFSWTRANNGNFYSLPSHRNLKKSWSFVLNLPHGRHEK